MGVPESSQLRKKIGIMLIITVLFLCIPMLLSAATYYSQGSDNFGTLTNWNTQRDGSGSNPSSILSTDDFVIQNTHTITLDTTYTINSLTIESGGTYTGSSTDTLKLNGDFTSNGSLTSNPIFEFVGSGTQVIDGSSIQFAVIIFSGSGTFAPAVDFIADQLLLSNGTFNAGTHTYTLNQSGSGSPAFYKTGGTFNANTSTFRFSSTSSTNQYISSNSAISFYKIAHVPGGYNSLAFDGGVTYTITNQLSIEGSSYGVSLVNSSSLDLSSAKLVYNRSSGLTAKDEWPISSSYAPNSVEIDEGTVTVDPGSSNTLQTNNLLINATGTALSISSGTVQVNSTLTITSGTIALNGGAFAWGSGTTTLVYNESGDQSVGPEWTTTIAPDNLTVNKSVGSLSLGSSSLASLSGNLTLTNGTVDYSATGLSLTVAGNVIGGSGSFGTTNDNTLIVTGTNSQVTSTSTTTLHNLTMTGSNAVVKNGITIEGTLTIDPGSSGTVTLGTTGVTLSTGASLTVSSGTLNLNGNTITKNGSNTLTVAAGAQLTTGGSAITGFSTYSFASSSTLLFNGGASENIPLGVSYGNIEVNKSASTLSPTGTGSITLQNGADLTITAGTFDLNGETLVLGNNSDLVVNGGALNLHGGTLTITGGNTNTLTVASGATLQTGGTSIANFDTYTMNGSVIFNGSSAETIPSGITSFNNLTINNGSGVSAAGSFSVGGTLTLAAGTLTPATLTLTGTLASSGSGNFSGSAGTVVLQGSAAQSLGRAFTFNNLTVNNTNGINLSADITVNGTLALNSGIIHAGSNAVNMGTGASFSGGSASSYIDGQVAKTFANGSGSTSFTIPMGKGSDYLPFTISFSGVSGGNLTTTVEQFNSDPHSAVGSSIDVATLSAISTVRYWQCSRTGGTPSNLQITLSWNSNDGVSNLTALDVAQYVSGQWTSVGGDGNGSSSSGTIQSNVITQVGDYFTFGDDAAGGQDNSLPVTLTLFEARASYNQVILSWKTESEIENMGFNIYRQEKGVQQWVKINEELIQGAGNSSISHEYQFVDYQVNSQKAYAYRLESVSYTGEKEIFAALTREVEIPVPDEFALLPNFPNPFNPVTTIRFLMPEQQDVSIYIYDIRGNLISKLMDHQALGPGEHRVQWDATNQYGQKVSSGTYFYRLVSNKFTKIGKMIYMR